MAEGKSFRLGDEVRYIQRRLPTAMGASSPLVSLFLFSTETGDAWLLDPSDRRAARLAGDGDPEPVHIEENDTCFVIDWKGNDRIEGPAFIYSDRQTRRVSTILGYVLKFQISLARVISYVSRQDAKTLLTMAQAVKARKLVIPIERKLLLFIRVGLPGHRERCTLTTP